MNQAARGADLKLDCANAWQTVIGIRLQFLDAAGVISVQYLGRCR
jgi:hypothetical protein